MPKHLLAALLLIGSGLLPAAQASAPVRTSPPAAQRIVATPITLPQSAYLQGVGHVYQTLNNCGPASLLAILQHYGVNAGTQAELGRQLKPGKFMTTGVIAPYLAQFGLAAPIYRQGSIGNIRPFIASGIPVLILQYLNGPGSVPHFRVVRGYDDASQRIYMSDSIYGPNVYLSYTDFNKLWTVYNNEFIPVYPTSLSPLLPNMVAGTAYRTNLQ